MSMEKYRSWQCCFFLPNKASSVATLTVKEGRPLGRTANAEHVEKKTADRRSFIFV